MDVVEVLVDVVVVVVVDDDDVDDGGVILTKGGEAFDVDLDGV